jgi:polyphosphate kinase
MTMLTQDETPASDTPSVNLDDPSLYINRETSWLQFNWRVLEEALCPAQPLLERVKFLAICASNLDEFFMIRVSGLRRQVIEGVLTAPPDGMTPAGQLAAVHEEVERQLARHTACWQQDLLPKLREAGIEIKTYDALQPKQQDFLHDYFAQEIFPTLTPLAFDPAHPFPHISNLSLNLAVVVHDPDFGERFARVKVPDVFPRLIPVPREEDPDALSATSEVPYPGYHLVWIEDVLAAHLEMLFPGLDIVASYPFRVTRDADLEIQEDEASDLVTMRAGESSDLLTTMEEQIGQRHFGLAIRLELVHDTPPHIRTILTRNLELTPSEVYAVDAPLGMANLMELMRLDRPDLKDAPFLPRIPAALAQNVSLFEAIRRQNILLYHP